MAMTALVILATIALGIGVMLLAAEVGRSPSVSTSVASLSSRLPVDARVRLVRAVVAALVLGLATRWPVAFAAGAAIGWFSSDVLGNGAARQRNIARTEAIASWTEMLRDTIGSAHGLEETIITSARVAPDAIRPEVTRLAIAIERRPLRDCLREFSADLSHPTGDLVVAALLLATDGTARDLGDLFGTLAVAARDEAGMYLRVDAARARMRTAVKVITFSTIATAVVLAFINRSYLAAYGDASGQLMLLLIAIIWGFSLKWLSSMSRFDQPERFLAQRSVTP
jgi:tight adherence protein B